MPQTIEQLLAQAILGVLIACTTMSDAYKFSMAQAGFALRQETFVLTFRKGGPFYIPFDLNAVVQAFLPSLPTTKEAGFLAANGYPMTTAMEKALQGKVTVVCPPQGSWVGKGEPILSVTGPSFLVSWLEPLLIMLQYPIQIATAMKQSKICFTATVTCEDEAKIVYLVGQRMGTGVGIIMDTEGYLARVRANVKAVVDALGGEAHRAFEVGLRAATCMQQHLMVLDVCESLGVRKTSNVYGAWLKYMIPVGTTGHEHQMRWGGTDADDRHGYRAIRDMRPEPPSYLFDTTDPINKGIPAALEVIAEDPTRPCSLRFDSGDQDAQFLKIKEGCDKMGVYPTLPFEDSYTAEKTAKNEAFCDLHGYPKEKRMYGFGGFFVSQPAKTEFNRDRASAAFKLSWTAGLPKMKFSGSPGKESTPGKPCILTPNWDKFLDQRAQGLEDEHMIAQEDEVVEGYVPIQPLEDDISTGFNTTLSPATAALKARLTKEAGKC